MTRRPSAATGGGADWDNRILPAGATLVATEQLEVAHVLLSKIVASPDPAILQIVGPPGSGKTTAVDEWCELHPDVEVARIALGELAKGNQVIRELLAAMGCPTGGDGLALRRRAVDALRGRSILIFIDEADMMNRAALRQIRYLFDYSEWLIDANGRRRRVWPLRFGVVLVGSDFSTAWSLAPDLRSRVDWHASFGRIEANSLKRVLAAYHPVFAKTPVSLLRAIDSESCRGLWRDWRKLLRQVLDRRPDAVCITEEMAERLLGVSGAAV